MDGARGLRSVASVAAMLHSWLEDIWLDFEFWMDNRSSNCNSPGTTTIPPRGNFFTILSIEGCGIQDVIPATMLSFLESELQALDGEDARLADFFDVVAGTNTGGLMTAMLTTPDENNRPLFAAKDIKDFYLNHASEISPPPSPSSNNPIHQTIMFFAQAYSSVRKSTNLDQLFRKTFGNTKLHQTLTNVVIPTFDLNILLPVLFCSYEVKNAPPLDALLSDICIATLPSPACLQPHSFTAKDGAGNAIGEFKMVDGSVAINNLTLLAMREVVYGCSSNSLSRRSSSRPKYLVLSLGSGSKKSDKVNFTEVSGWSKKHWIIARHFASEVDRRLREFFRSQCAECNYLHIQDDILGGVVFSVNEVSKEILDCLGRVRDDLLEKPVSKVGLDLDMGEGIIKLKHPGGRSNADALKRFAKLLSDEKRKRSSDESCAARAVAISYRFLKLVVLIVMIFARVVVKLFKDKCR